MRSVLRHWVALLAFGGTLVPIAQVRAQDARELERRTDSMVSMRISAAARLAAYRQLPVARRTYPDTVAMLDGAFLVITDHDLVPLVRAATARADEFVRHRTARPSLLKGMVLAVWTDSTRRQLHGLFGNLRVNGRPGSDEFILADPVSLGRAIVDRAQAQLSGKGGATLGHWLGGALPVDTSTTDDWRAVRLDLVSSRAKVSHLCYAGDLAACKVTLGLVEAHDPVTTWYDSATRRSAVYAVRRFGGLDRWLTTSCLAGRDSACIVLLRTSPSLQSWSSAPGSPRARVTLVQQAFAVGGPSALDRLAVSNDSSAAGAISALANAPVDSVVSQWQRHAHDGGIESAIATPVIVMASLGWVLAMGAISLRSPRWR